MSTQRFSDDEENLNDHNNRPGKFPRYDEDTRTDEDRENSEDGKSNN